MKPYIYIRTLKHAEHTVFCVQEGQKAYFDPLFNRMVPYSSGQQIKRCILTTLTDDLNVPMAPITFNYNITKKDGLENKETLEYSLCWLFPVYCPVYKPYLLPGSLL